MARLGLVAMVLALSVSAQAAMSITDLNPGTTVSGPALTTKDMKGKVVLVMYWGVR
ncbi:MAG TPA: hypothetical protein VEK08_04500 [Planctomycetota bacterium]|nr:hypothetical protein [Planctomycetota bacterium]